MTQCIGFSRWAEINRCRSAERMVSRRKRLLPLRGLSIDGKGFFAVRMVSRRKRLLPPRGWSVDEKGQAVIWKENGR